MYKCTYTFLYFHVQRKDSDCKVKYCKVRKCVFFMVTNPGGFFFLFETECFRKLSVSVVFVVLNIL